MKPRVSPVAKAGYAMHSYDWVELLSGLTWCFFMCLATFITITFTDLTETLTAANQCEYRFVSFSFSQFLRDPKHCEDSVDV